MDLYKVILKPSVEKDFKRLDRNLIQRILSAIEGLAKNPFPPSSKKLVGAKNTFRIRIGDYRIVYTYVPTIKTIEVQAIKHRKDVYR